MLINVNAEELRYVFANTPSSQNIMLVGKHGIGKSEIVKSHFESKGVRVVTVFCSQAADPGDIIGLPKYDESTGRTDFALPWWFPSDGKPVVLFLDELNRARPEILQVVMDLTLNRRLAGHSLPEGSMVISAINGGDEYQLTELDPALLSRFNVYLFKPTVSDWLEWGMVSGIDADVLSFIRENNRFLDDVSEDSGGSIDKSYDRRSWVRVSDIMKRRPAPDANLKRMLCGIIGSEAGVAFFDYISSIDRVRPSDLLTDFNAVKDRIDGMDIPALTGLVTEVMSYINCNVGDESPSDPSLDEQAPFVVNMRLFVKYLSENRKEAMSYLASLTECCTYPKANFFNSTFGIEEMVVEFVEGNGNAR